LIWRLIFMPLNSILRSPHSFLQRSRVSNEACDRLLNEFRRSSTDS